MPRRPLHPCNQHGCPALTDQRHCDRHRKQADAADRERRGSAAQRGYDADHQRWRKMVLDNDPLCVVCLEDGRTVFSVVADHIIPLGDGGSWDVETNGQGLCTTCHGRKTAREREARKAAGTTTTIYVPVGIPACGKSVYYEQVIRARAGVDCISPETYLVNGRRRDGDQRRIAAWRKAVAVAWVYSVRGQSFYFDATHLTVRAREPMLDLAGRHGSRCVALWFQTPLALCMERNAERTGERRVRESEMVDLDARFEPPTKAEGFETIVEVESVAVLV